MTTPSPWRVNEHGILLGADGNVEIARSVLKADAPLIAAAPDLLAALEGIASVANQASRHGDKVDLISALGEIMVWSSAAIAKTTGEQS